MKLFDSNGNEVFIVTTQWYDEFTVFISPKDLSEDEIREMEKEYSVLADIYSKKATELNKKLVDYRRPTFLQDIELYKKELEESGLCGSKEAFLRERLGCQKPEKVMGF